MARGDIHHADDPISRQRFLLETEVTDVQRGALPELGRIVGTPLPLPTAHPPKRTPQEVKALAFAKVYQSTLLGINLNLDFR